MQALFLILFSFLNLAFFVKAVYEINRKRNAYKLTNYLFFIGAFVWGDVFVLSPFWILVSGISLFLNNWNLFLLFVSLFWVIRSFGEIMYWLNEQFANKHRNLPENLNFHRIIKSDAIWFIYQLFWQCIFVFALITALFIGKQLL